MKHSLLGINISLKSYKEFIDELIALARIQKSSYVCVANVHMLVEARQNATFADVVNNADLCAADGMPLVWGLDLVHGIKQQRVCGMDLLPDTLAAAEHQSIPVYFYGGSQEMLDHSFKYIKQKYPDLPIAGMLSPPFRPLSDDEEKQHMAMINSSGAKILFVALGCPKQEKWMAHMKGKIQMPMIGIGGALPVLVGLQKRAPIWMQKASLEWLFRFAQEPRRLFKRYFITNTIFLSLLAGAVFRSKIARLS